MDVPPPKAKKRNSQAFLRISNYLSKFSPSTAVIWGSLRQLTSSKTEWTWNATYQKLFDKAKSIIKEDVCMIFYDETQLLYLETNVKSRTGSCPPINQRWHKLPKR